MEKELKEERKENFIWKIFNKQRGEKYKRQYYHKPSLKNKDFLEKSDIVLPEKTIISVAYAEKWLIM